VQGGWAWLAVIGMLNSVVAAYYYLRVVVAMYFEEPGSDTVTTLPDWSALKVGMAIAAVFTVFIGIFPGIWTGFLQMGMGG
jgi:NADH-quinone oxidoreductase subunit N